jgi:transposase-like protein
MEICKFCGGKELVKNGIVLKKQRYKCKTCGKNGLEGDERVKYDFVKKLKVVKMYLEGIGIRSIERLEGVPNTLIIKWIRRFSGDLKAELAAVEIPNEVKKIEILEVDELFSYVQKKVEKFTFGLPPVETGIKLLISK